jgi:hypothetical protein
LNGIRDPSVLEDHEGRHRGDAIASSQLLLIVCVDFGKGDFVRLRQVLRQLLVDGSYLFAWTTPIGIEVGDHDCRIR